jgi:capsular polysaccharide transport system permease protein
MMMNSQAVKSSRATLFVATFFFTVVVPTAVASLYFGLVASDVFISESRFVVRSPQRQVQTGLGALIQGATGLTRAQDDTYSVHDYVLSRDALNELQRFFDVKKSYTAEEISLFNRFPGVWRDNSFEAFHEYYLKHVTIAYDPVSSISTLRVRAFTPEAAARINEVLLSIGERLINGLNARSRTDLLQSAQSEVKLAEERSRAAALALSAFRSDRGVFDPERQGGLQLQAEAKLREDLVAAESQLAQVQGLSPNNPQISALQSRIEILRRALRGESSRLTSRESGISQKSPAFDRLTLEKGFADRQLAAAFTALDTARSEVLKKQLYLERLVQPHTPDSAVEPRRIRSVFTVFVLGLIAWGIISLIVASVREHIE